MYRSVKKTWIPYKDAIQSYGLKVDEGRFIHKIPYRYKEKVCGVWFVSKKYMDKIIGGNKNE